VTFTSLVSGSESPVVMVMLASFH